MKNIYLYNKQPNQQNQLDVNQLTINQKLTLTGADPNELLITNSNSEVVTFNNGPSRYLLEIDGTTLKPSWTNNILIDDITTNTMTINNTQQADLLTIGDNIGSVERLPVGLDGQVLVSDATTFGLNYKYIKDILSLEKGNVFVDGSNNIFTEPSYTGVENNVITFNTNPTGLFAVLANFYPNRVYKITISWNNTIQGNSSNLYTFEVNNVQDSFITFAKSSRESVTFIYVSPYLSGGYVQLIGSNLPNTPADAPSSLGSARSISILSEPLGVV